MVKSNGSNQVVNGVKTTVSNVFNSVKTKVTTVWNSIRDAIKNPIEKARDLVKGAIDKIKGFMNFKWELPKLKLPKFSITGKFGIAPPSVPKMSVKWNAKGAIFDGATVLGGGQGVGEAGAEAVLPIQHKRYMRPFANAVASHLDSKTSQPQQSHFPEKVTVEIPVNLNGTEVARLVEDDISRLLLDRQKRTNRI